MKKLSFFCILAAALCAPHASLAEFYGEGLQAFEAGDYARARAVWEPLAKAGDARTQLALGSLYADGRGVTADPVKAVYWYQRAAEQGLAEAQYRLGKAHAEGTGTPVDQGKALMWLRSAGNAGNASAQFELGMMYAAGTGGVAKDAAMAVHWFTEAAARQHLGAQYNLATLYLRGEGVDRNERVALSYFELAAQGGNKRAQKLLADAYENGWFGLPRDPARARRWRDAAAGP